MSTDVSPGTGPSPATATGTEAPATPGPGTRARSWPARHRAGLLIALGLLAAVAVVLVAGGGAQTSTPFDPANPGPDGARALARVLADQGVDVVVARDADELDATEVDAGTTVLVTTPEYLGTSTIARLLDHVGGARLVVAGAGPGTTEAFGSSGAPSRVAGGDGIAADCADPLLSGLRLEVDRALVYPGEGCFPDPDPGSNPGSDAGPGSVLAQGADGVRFFGAEEALTNDQVLRGDNAAVALRLLGQGDRLVWYVPSVDDLLGDDGVSVATLLPRWLQPGLVLAALAGLALVAWRARRLGALAVEPLPVVVTAIETTRSRGRLYRRSGDRGHAAAALRSAARTRVAERLRLGPRADPAAVVREVARLLERRVEEVDALLGPQAPPPATDKDLIILANDLAELDREVRRP